MMRTTQTTRAYCGFHSDSVRWHKKDPTRIPTVGRLDPVNWLLNVYPLLKPALSNVYEKISRKSQTHAQIFVSKAITDHLDWFISHVQTSYGIPVFQATDWAADEADVTAHGDASRVGMGFYFAESNTGYQSTLPHDPPKDVIFYFESIGHPLHHPNALLSPCHSQMTQCFQFDNMNTVDIFSLLQAKLLQHGLDLWVIHIPRVDNVVADALSHFNNSQALTICPSLSVSTFEPP
jgi:hypothetical protein